MDDGQSAPGPQPAAGRCRLPLGQFSSQRFPRRPSLLRPAQSSRQDPQPGLARARQPAGRHPSRLPPAALPLRRGCGLAPTTQGGRLTLRPLGCTPPGPGGRTSTSLRVAVVLRSVARPLLLYAAAPASLRHRLAIISSRPAGDSGTTVCGMSEPQDPQPAGGGTAGDSRSPGPPPPAP